MLKIARDKKNIEKRERNMKNGKKSSNNKKQFFTFIFLYRKCYVLLENNLVYITTCVLPIFCVADSLRRSNKIIDLHWSSSKLTTQNTW